MDLRAKPGCPEEELEETKKIVLDSIVENMESVIQEGNYGAFSTVDSAYHGFYPVQWQGSPYVANEDHVINGETFVSKGELLVKARYLDKIPRASGWWDIIDEEVVVRVQHVLVPDLRFNKVQPGCQLPRTIRHQDRASLITPVKLPESERERVMRQILI